jgi:hypothetical protein
VGYADLAAARTELGLSSNEPGDADAIALLESIDEALTLRFNNITGKAWGVYAAETRTKTEPGVSSLLVLDDPLTTLTSVEEGGEWNGTAWTNGTTVATTYLRLIYGGHAIERRDGAYWYGPTRITGTWGDEVNGSPPADVVAGLTEGSVAEYRRRIFNARDTTQGFDALEATPPPRAENGPLYKAAVQTHRTKVLVIA